MHTPANDLEMFINIYIVYTTYKCLGFQIYCKNKITSFELIKYKQYGWKKKTFIAKEHVFFILLFIYGN